MAFSKGIRGVHLISLLQEVYGWKHPDLPNNIERWEGIAAGSVNSNFLVELQMPATDEPDAGRRRVIVTFMEPGGADAVPEESLDYYMALLRHIDERSLEFFTIEDKEKIYSWMEEQAVEVAGMDQGKIAAKTINEGHQIRLLMTALNAEKSTQLRKEFADFKRNKGINPVRFRVPFPFYAQGLVKNPDKELGPLWVDYTYKPLEHDTTRQRYDEGETVQVVPPITRPVVVAPFLDGMKPDQFLKDQEPKKSLESLTPEEFLELDKSSRDAQNVDYLPLKILYRVGQALAAFHRSTEDFDQTMENRMGVDKWPEILNGVQEQRDVIDHEVGEGFIDKLTIEIERLVKEWQKVEKGLQKGTIHGDLFPDNVIMSGLSPDKKVRGSMNVGIIDPWAASTDSLLLDIGIVLASWCATKDGKLLRENAQAFLAGYDSVRERTPEEKKATMLAARVGSARFALTRANMRANPEVPREQLRDPQEYLDKAATFSILQKTNTDHLEPLDKKSRGR